VVLLRLTCDLVTWFSINTDNLDAAVLKNVCVLMLQLCCVSRKSLQFINFCQQGKLISALYKNVLIGEHHLAFILLATTQTIRVWYLLMMYSRTYK